MAMRPSISALFPPFPKDMTMYERTKITVKRHQNDYFKDWEAERFEEEHIPDSWRPVTIPVTQELYAENLKKNEVLRNKKLAYCMEMAITRTNEWALTFRQEIKDGRYTSITQIKDMATHLWKMHSDHYDPSRAVHIPSLTGRGPTIRRKRRSGETETQYRRRLKDTRPSVNEEQGMQLQSILDSKDDIRRIIKMNRHQLTEYLNNSEGYKKLQDLEPLPAKTKEDNVVSAIMAFFADN